VNKLNLLVSVKTLWLSRHMVEIETYIMGSKCCKFTTCLYEWYNQKWFVCDFSGNGNKKHS